MKPHVQTWKLIHKTENGSGQGTGRASDLLRGEVAARPGWKPDQEPGDSNGTWTVPRADGVDPHAGSQLTARGDPLKHPAARNRESSRSAGPSRAGQLRAPAAQEGAVTLRTPRRDAPSCTRYPNGSPASGRCCPLSSPTKHSLFGATFPNCWGRGRTYPTRPSEPPALAPSALRAMPPRPLHPEPLGAAARGRDGLSPAPGPSPGHGHGTWPAELLAQGSFGNTNCFFMTKAIHAHGLKLCTRSKESAQARGRALPGGAAGNGPRPASENVWVHASPNELFFKKKKKEKEEKRKRSAAPAGAVGGHRALRVPAACPRPSSAVISWLRFLRLTGTSCEDSPPGSPLPYF